MSGLIVKSLYAFLPIIFGITLACSFAGVSITRKNIVGFAIFICYAVAVRYCTVFYLDGILAAALYPFIVHLPMLFLLVFYCKCSWVIAAISIFTAFLSYQLPYWCCYFIIHLYNGNPWMNILIYMIACCAFLCFMLRYVAAPIRQIIHSSLQTCLAFGWAPLSYHLFYHLSIIQFQGFTQRSNFIVGLMTFIIGVVYIIFAIEYNRKLQLIIQSERERSLLSSQAMQASLNLRNLQKTADLARIYRHDMRHHLSMIMGFLEQEQTDKAKQYICSAISDIDSFTPQHFCKNQMVDLLLSMFFSQAAAADITLNTKASVPENLTISETDLCSLLSNALENAIHAAEVVSDQEKTIYFQCNIIQNNLLIQLDNPVSETPDILNGIPQTKEDGHGLGTKSMINIVNRYHGIYHCTCKDKIFSLKIVLPQ